jgi:hypothetical protein
MAEEKVPQQGEAEKSTSVVGGVVKREAEELGLAQVDLVKAALKWQYNWIGLAGAALFALLSGTGMPLVLAAGLEMIYLSLAPRSSAFRRLVRSWKYAEQKRQREVKLGTMFNEMPPELRTRYAALDSLCAGIRANYSRLSSTSQMFLEQMEQRLRGLLEAYLRLLYADFQHSEYLQTTDPDPIKQNLTRLQRALTSDPPQVQEINRRRIEILGKRLEKYQKVHDNQKVVQAQCAAIEDVLQLINDQSVTMRDPQQVSDQLDSLVHDVEQTEETVRQVEAVFEMAVPGLEEALPPLPSEPSASSSPTSAPSSRVRN